MEIGFTLAQLNVTKFLYEFSQLIVMFFFPVMMIYIIGTIYYVLRLIQPPTISFKQATSTDWVIVSSIVFWMIMVISKTIVRLLQP
ncbi:hypothetical protein IQ266_15005 [filamentous cyanobacterium LEGE 11480]|uniref:Uncharacterized protein n=1 Tax=Romeriopsis navalis LEGE 11480 TaxID=2777977 RepID=A0A928VM20_9CYAN|nr:hypothetical protein [Romeriopsis navalis]MBE9031041.1 hypothetical protein [Romeriopsis navalis LEGE 11480]